MKLIYEQKKFRPATLDVIDQANAILEEYARQGFDLTLRQLFYQFVSRALIPNLDREYKKLGSIVNDARLAGMIDWDRIVDRTRNLQSLNHWNDPADVIESTTKFFRTDLWDEQSYRVEVWIEKDALAGVIEPTCQSLDVPFISCRGYMSQSEMWSAGQRLLGYVLDGKHVRILHLGDHDPSGIDMSRDIEERLRLFLRNDWLRAKRDEWVIDGKVDEARARELMEELEPLFQVDRLALNMDQIDQYDPPPNPAKVTDSRAEGYIAEFGYQSWELDALEPTVLAGLIQTAVGEYMDDGLFDEAVEREEKYRKLLQEASRRWSDVEQLLDGDGSRDGS